MAKHWYGIEYAYGRNVINNGNRPDRVVRFATRAERDAWADRGPERPDESGYRSALPATHKLVKALLRHPQTLWERDERSGRHEYAL